MHNIHASSIIYKDKCILILGASGSGKSDLCLRLIVGRGAVLIADDRTDIFIRDNEIIASCPREIKGLLEVRGIGIKKVEYAKEHKIDIVVELVKSLSEIERMPNESFYEFEGCKVPKIKLFPFEISSIDKLEIALTANSETKP